MHRAKAFRLGSREQIKINTAARGLCPHKTPKETACEDTGHGLKCKKIPHLLR
ncbi:hypothetical protein SAMN05421780_11188 [Flexibacter flexilis DSM 6793]|uniref:Uncharacterized protein n=1 Tax=Flexibacter flexilis DSM 6793 TaxID=927664 RepID=A0A1I1N0T7_9BACT|nr:hypothetical protein SAMN05421780_11188 [Flexibacter flexilis DSM 6793]